MAIIPGSVRMTGFIAPTDSTDTFAVHDEIYGRGGFRTVADLTERDAITPDRRRTGMLVKVLNAGSGETKTFTLIGGITNSDWQQDASFKGITQWVTGKSYLLYEYVATPDEIFVVLINHVSTSMNADLAAGRILPASDKMRMFYADSDISVNPVRKNLFLCDTTDNSITITLSGVPSPWFNSIEIIFKKIGGVYPLTITPSGGTTIDGRTSWLMTEEYETLRLVFDIDLDTWWVV